MAATAALAVLALNIGDAAAQSAWNSAPRNPACTRLEAQLAAVDRGGNDARAEQVRRYEEAANKQQMELDRMSAQARRQGCEGGGFFLFGGGVPPQCDQINGQIQRMRSNLERILSGLRQLQHSGGDREEQRRAVLVSLAQNDCGPQYRNAARPRGFLETLFGAPAQQQPDGSPAEAAQSSGYRTVCVRSCDGFFFPISFSTNQSRFREDEQICQRMCPAAEVALYSHRNPGEDIAQAVALNGQSYAQHANAFRYRQEFNAACTCKRANESWVEAVPDDKTVERGDIVVTEERARTLSQPKAEPQSKPAQSPPRRDNRRQAVPAAPKNAQAGAEPAAAPAAAPSPPPRPAANANPPRAVGPQFYR